MCSLTSPVVEEKQSTRVSNRIKKRKQRESTSMDITPSNLEASRKIRTKTKKPKFLSLKLELNTCQEKQITYKTKKKTKKQSKAKKAETTSFKEKKKKTEYPLGGGDKEDEQYDTVAAYLFNSATDSTISSIHDLLPSSAVDDADCDGGRDLSPYDRHRRDHGGSSSSSLLRTAMRKGASEEEETTEERWVSYSEVVEEVMSRSGTPRCSDGGGGGRPSLALKLDYDQIMEAWSGKDTPLYVNGEPPQTVPDLHASSDVFTDGGEAGNLWAVPEMETTEMLWRGHREASLLRYKEKRRNRLFSKRIRYQVRKLNAEKRPRIKGRFVKREDL